MAEKKALEIGDVRPPKQLLEKEFLYTRDNSTYCVRPSCDGCQFDPDCTREEKIIKIGPGINIREGFRVRPGYKWACIDFAGIELRVAALLSGEPVWVKAFQEDRDLHSAMGCIMFKVDEPDKAQRDIAKMGNFGNLYLSGVDTFWHLTTLTYAEAAIAWKKWWAAVPVYERWTRNQEDYYKKYGHVWTFFRRKREMKRMIEAADANIGKGKGKAKGKKLGHGFCKRTACNCLFDETSITTNYRCVTIGELFRTGILNGERVWNGVSSEEFKVHDAGYKEAWEIEFESGSSIIASEDHLFKVYQGEIEIISQKSDWMVSFAEAALRIFNGVPLRAREIEKISVPRMPSNTPVRILMRRHLIPCGLFQKKGYSRYAGYVPIKSKIEEMRRGFESSRPSTDSQLGWVSVGDLQPGMFVAQNNKAPESGRVVAESELNHCELLGIAAGDGCYTQIPRRPLWFVFNSVEEDSWLKTQSLLSQEGYFFRAWKKDRSREGKKPVFMIALKAESSRRFVKKTDLVAANAHIKSVPDYVKTRGPLGWKAFLRGYRTTDGTNARWNQRTTTVSLDLADDVLHLYQSLGLRPTFHSSSDMSAWFVDTLERVTADQEIGWNASVKEMEQTQGGLCVPPHLARRVGSYVYQSDVFDDLPHGKKCHIHSLKKGSSSLVSVREFAAVAQLDLIELYYAYEKVKSVKRLGVLLPMKDIEVTSGRPEFMANGVLVHNSPIQGTSADLLKMAMTRVDDFVIKEKLRDDVRMMLTVHDELDFEIRENAAMFEILREIGRQMTLTPKGKTLPMIPNWNIPLKVDIEVGDNWGNLVGIDDLDPATKDLPRQEKASPKKDQVTLMVSGITSEDANKLHMAIFQAANVPDVVKVPLMIKMGDRVYASKALEKVSEGHIRRLIQGIPGVKML